jgi:hypothetical protein
MANINANDTLKRLRSHYRLVLMNEDTCEEVVRFKLSRMSVYVIMSSLFVLMISLTTALIIFTPLKYYLPGVGYGNAKTVKEYRKLKLRTDSMEQALRFNNRYVENLQKVLQGNVSTLDTNLLTVPQMENTDE